jgi:hypothetical protein
MSRDDGFARADIDSSYLDDAKMRALWRLLDDPDRMARAVLLHEATLLSSWRHGERVTVQESAPIWLPVDEALVAALVEVRLLDKSGRIAPASWKRWIGPAIERRDARRTAGAAGGRASGKRRSSIAEATVQQPSSDAEPNHPTIRSNHPTVPSVNGTAAASPVGGAGGGLKARLGELDEILSGKPS